MNRLVLASSSSYRKALLQRLQLPFSCSSPNIEETAFKDETAIELAQRLSLEKARVVADKYPDSLVIGSDQVAELVETLPGGTQRSTILGKPGSHQQAVTQLTAQSGQKVYFHSGLAVIGQGREKSLVNTTEVNFRTLSSREIENYLSREKSYDCAGSFKAESLGISLFESVVSDDPSSLIGLPLIDLCRLLRQFGMEI